MPTPNGHGLGPSAPSHQPDIIKLNHEYGHRLILSHFLFTAGVFLSTYFISYYGFQTAVETNEPSFDGNKWLHVPSRQVNVTDFHLSTSLDYGIARCVGSLCLPLIGVFFVLVALWRYFYVHAHLPNRKTTFTIFPHKRNNMSLLCSVIGGIGIAGVGAFPSIVHKPLHFFFAFIAFGNICMYMALQVNLDKSLKLYQLNDTEKMLHGARITLTALACCGLVGMITSMKVLKRKDWSSMFELLMAGGFLIFLCTFANQASVVQISLTAKLADKTSGGLVVETALEVCEKSLEEEDDLGRETSRVLSRDRTLSRLAFKGADMHHRVEKLLEWGGGTPWIGGEDGEGHAETTGESEASTIVSFKKMSVIGLRKRAQTD